MPALLQARIDREGLRNITPVQGREDDPRLAPDSIAAALLLDGYHAFAYPFEMMRAHRSRARGQHHAPSPVACCRKTVLCPSTPNLTVVQS